ncbi:MAG: anaerobic glycerol-3-phosphate dehydrogenase subunit B [candidate division Zixibacteria bacterium]|nr:anaerobic glycerol-3-phosphate dehydrogenase subunit B [candidate division Zixibacteria bacterium]
MRYDVIVIGTGLSGLMAAKQAADSGLRAMVLGKGMGMMHVLPGGIDLLGYYPGDNREVQNEVYAGLTRLIQEKPDHPYARVGLEDIEKSIRSFSELFTRQSYHYTGEPGENIMLPTGLGSLRPSYLVPSTMIAGKRIFSKPTLLIGFHGFGNFYPAYAARSLLTRGDRNKGLRVRSEKIEVSDIGGRSTFKAASLAIQFDEESFREKVSKRISRVIDGEELVGFPAVLGLRDAVKVKLDMEAWLGADVFELPILPPSIPGMRLFGILQNRLRARGVRVILGFEVISAMQQNGRCHGVVLKTPSGERIHQADSFVLATGGLFGGGLKVQGDRVFEPIFNLPVTQPESRKTWFQSELIGRRSHPVNRAGITTNGRLNPVDEKGRVLLENLFAVGSILGHHDSRREKSKTGVAIATGYKAIRSIVGR